MFYRGLFYFSNQGGGDDRTRTDHLSNANAALYQMSYVPNEFYYITLEQNYDTIELLREVKIA